MCVRACVCARVREHVRARTCVRLCSSTDHVSCVSVMMKLNCSVFEIKF